MRIVDLELSDVEQIRSALCGVDRVYWCAGGPLPAESEADVIGAIERRTRTLDLVLRAMAMLEVPPRIVLFSSGGTVYGEVGAAPVAEAIPPAPVTAYGIASLCTERLAIRYGFLTSTRALVLRCGNVYGHRQRSGRSQGVIANVIDAARSGRRFTVFGDGTTIRDYVLLDDVVDVAVRLPMVSDTPSIVNVGTQVGTTVLEVVAAVERELGVELELDFVDQRVSDLQSVVLDTTLLQSLLGFDAVTLTEGLRRTIGDADRTVRGV